jgi:MFS family permease
VPALAAQRAPAATTGPPLDRRALLFVLLLAFSQDAVYALVFLSYMNHYLLDVLDASAGMPGYTLALYGGIKLVTHPLAGRLLDRTSPRLVFRLTVAVQVGAAVLLLAVHTLSAFFVATVLLAVGSAAMWPLTYETVARTQPLGARTRAAGILALVGYIATGIGFAVGVGLSRLAPWRVAFLVTGAVVALPGLFQGAGALGAGLREEGPEPAAEPPGQRRGIALFGVVLFLDYAAISAMAGIYGPYARLSLDISLLKTTMLLIPAGAAALASLYFAARWSRPHRRFLEMSLLYVIATVGAFALAATTTPLLASAFAVVLALGIGGIGPIVAAAMLDFGGRRSRGFVIGTLMSVEGLGAVVGPAAAATFADLLDPRAGLAFIGALMAVLAVLTALGSRSMAGTSD